MLVFPAIDLLGGKVVRLYQGDYAQKQQYGSDPADFARQFWQKGATHLHVVDLDGAKAGAPQNFASVQAIVAQGGLLVQLGGGIRNEETVERCFEAGVARVILGTAALRDAAFTRRMLQKYPGKIAIGVDAKNGKVAVEGWLQASNVDSLGFCRTMAEAGAEYVIYTDIARDGAMAGANLEVYRQLAQIKGLKVTASGGVSSLQDIAALRSMGLYAAILGKALYTGAVQLEQAIQAAGEGSA